MSGANGYDVDSVRRFNRFYTRRIGVLDEGHLNSQYSLAEVRVLYELAHHERTTAVELCRDLGLDAGYVSRILQRFTRQRLIRRTRAPSDRRQSWLALTPKGKQVFAPLNAAARDHVQALLTPLSAHERRTLVAAMRRIEALLSESKPSGR
ncbi:MAG TPA: MarR family winged helix-turn-helix transcriptional regulator [Vicinamibacterales bacterium]|nr:MarR family winged helix-turn-helix transcriptional regulator [Vicinamibacterales bacterium]